MKVLQALLSHENSSLDQALKQLTAVIQIENGSAVIYGIGVDSVKCEDILTTDIKDATQKISIDEQASLKGAVWRNFASSLSTKCKGILYLEAPEK